MEYLAKVIEIVGVILFWLQRFTIHLSIRNGVIFYSHPLLSNVSINVRCVLTW